MLKKALPVASHENIYTVPNILTASRLVAAPFIGYCILHDHHTWALGLFAYAGITDLLDGWIARKWNQGTVVGTVIDPMADKALMTVLTVALAVKGALPGEWPASLFPSLESPPAVNLTCKTRSFGTRSQILNTGARLGRSRAVT